MCESCTLSMKGIVVNIGVRLLVLGRGGGGGQLYSQIRAKQWGKSGQSKKKKNDV